MATYYIRPTNGLDTNSGLTFALAFKSTQKAADVAVAGDTVRWIPEAAEVITAKIDFDINAGANINPILFETGNTTDGARDVSIQYTINTSSIITAIFEFAAASDYYRFYNVTLDANANATYGLYNNIDGADGNRFYNCNFINATSHGVNVRGAAAQGGWVFFECSTNNNSGRGINHSAANRGEVQWIGGSIHNNTGHGWLIDRTGCILHAALVYKNGGTGIYFGSNSTRASVMNTTIYGNTADGIYIYNATSRTNYEIVGVTLSNNGGYGINIPTTDQDQLIAFDYNHTYNNTSGASNVTLRGDNLQIGNPNFANTGVGTEDFTPANGSPLDSNGINGTDIGARKAADPSGGGGGAIVNQGIQSIESGISA